MLWSQFVVYHLGSHLGGSEVDVVTLTCNPSTGEAEAGESPKFEVSLAYIPGFRPLPFVQYVPGWSR